MSARAGAGERVCRCPEITEALRRALAGASDDALLARLVLAAAALVLAARSPDRALRFADAADHLRGELPPTAPEKALAHRIRRRTAGAPLPRGRPLDAAEVLASLGAWLSEAAG